MNNHQQKHGLPQSWAEPVLLVAALALFLLTMPAFLYPGDSYMSRAEAEWLLRSGRWGIPVEQAEVTLRDFIEVPGQYAVHRPDKNDYVSKFGVTYTLLAVIPLQMVNLLRDAVEFHDPERLTVLIFALYQSILLLIGLLYLFKIVRRIGAGPWLAAAFCFLSVFATYNWYYLRSSTHEALQWPWAMAFFWHLITAIRPDSRISRGHLSAVMFFLLVLVMCRPVYLVWLPALWVVVLAHAFQRSINTANASHSLRSLLPAINAALRKLWSVDLLLLFFTSLLLILVMLAVQAAKFGSPLATGYGVWVAGDGVSHDHFSLRYMLQSIPAFFFSLGRSSVWTHYPILVLAIFGWPFFWRKNRWDAALILLLAVSLLLVIACFSQWHAIFGAGPRYLILILPLLSLPAISGIKRIFLWSKCTLRTVTLTALIVAAVLLVALQFNVVLLHPHAILDCRQFFSMLQVENAERYYDGLLHPGLHTRDLMRFRSSGKGYPPMDKLRRRGAQEDGHVLHVAIEVLDGMTLPNLLLYNPPHWETFGQIIRREMHVIPFEVQNSFH